MLLPVPRAALPNRDSLPEVSGRNQYPCYLPGTSAIVSGMFAIDMPVRIPAPRSKPVIESRSIHIDVETWERLGAIATELKRKSRNSLVADILREWVASYDAGDIEPAPKKKQ